MSISGLESSKMTLGRKIIETGNKIIARCSSLLLSSRLRILILIFFQLEERDDVLRECVNLWSRKFENDTWSKNHRKSNKIIARCSSLLLSSRLRILILMFFRFIRREGDVIRRDVSISGLDISKNSKKDPRRSDRVW